MSDSIYSLFSKSKSSKKMENIATKNVSGLHFSGNFYPLKV